MCGQLVWPAGVGSHNSQSVTVTSLWWNRGVSQLTLNCLHDLITCSCTKSLGHKVHHRPCTHSPLARMNPQPRTRSARYSCEELSCAECSYFIVVSHNDGLHGPLRFNRTRFFSFFPSWLVPAQVAVRSRVHCPIKMFRSLQCHLRTTRDLFWVGVPLLGRA